MDASPFSLLPSELRNIIWEYALDEPSGIPIGTQPGLLRTCKTIRSEAELMFYAINHFRAQIEEENIKHDVCAWLCHLGEAKRKLIRGLEVHCVIAPASMSVIETDEPTNLSAEDDSFMQLTHLLDSIRQTNFSRRLEDAVSFTVSSTGEDKPVDRVFDDTKTFEEMDDMPIEEQECSRAAKFLILCCVYGREVLVDAMQEGEPSIAELDRRIQDHRKEYADSMTQGRWR